MAQAQPSAVARPRHTWTKADMELIAQRIQDYGAPFNAIKAIVAEEFGVQPHTLESAWYRWRHLLTGAPGPTPRPVQLVPKPEVPSVTTAKARPPTISAMLQAVRTHLDKLESDLAMVFTQVLSELEDAEAEVAVLERWAADTLSLKHRFSYSVDESGVVSRK